MSSIIYTPEQIKDPRNHARRIYFSCAEADFQLFKQVEQDIKEIEKDCVIAHRDFTVTADEQHFNQVSDFHLTIIPITENWFAEGVHNQEFDFLTQNHKTVLPILFDSNCEKRFNEKTDNMQFLRINDSDYKEKIKRNLEDILVDKNLIARVRKIFPHSMFVGYCREDFEYTQELIHCIHNEESGRRIAIWYDKYLPTGKNFEDSIFKELDNSQIVGITTTPNLISRENYVKEKEYPHAKKTAKKTVFFELVKTGAEEVRSYFDIHDNDPFEMVPVRRGHNFSKYINQLFSLNENKKSIPFKQDEVDSLLGYAYLNGLFVEFDSTYALKKFKMAANSGNVDAAHQLGNMYYRGIGVQRNVQEAFFWYKKEVVLVEKAYLETFETLREAKKIPLVTAPTEQMNALINLYRKSADDLLMRITTLASLLRDEGEFNQSKTYYLKALSVINGATENFSLLNVEEKHRAVIENELNLLLLLNEEADLPALKQTFERAKSQSNIFAIVKSGRNYGFALMLINKLSEAQNVFQDALEAAKEVDGDKEIDELVLLLHRDMGRSYLLCNPDEALKWFKSELWLLEDFSFDMDENPYLYFEFAWTKIFIGDAYRFKEDFAEAWRNYGLALSEIKKAEEKIGEKIFTADFPVCVTQLYSIAFSRLSNFIETPLEARVLFCKTIQNVMERFGSLEYHGFHKEMANSYFTTLKNALEHFS